MSYEAVLDDVAKVVEGVGAAILVGGGGIMLVRYALHVLRHTDGAWPWNRWKTEGREVGPG